MKQNVRVVAKIIIALISICLIALVVAYSFTQMLSTPESVSAQLEKSGAYNAVADTLHESISSSLKAAQIEGPNVETILVSSITPVSAKAAVRPTLIGLVDWLNSDSAKQPDFSIDLSNIKNSIVAGARRQGDTGLGFVATREIPDTMVLGSSGDKQQQPDLSGVKANYVAVSHAQLPLVGVACAGIVLLVLLAFRNSRRRVVWPGWGLLLAGAVGLALAFGLPAALGSTLLKPTSKANDPNAIILGLTKSLAEAAQTYFYILAFVGVVLILVGYVAFKTPEHKKKKK